MMFNTNNLQYEIFFIVCCIVSHSQILPPQKGFGQNMTITTDQINTLLKPSLAKTDLKLIYLLMEFVINM